MIAVVVFAVTYIGIALGRLPGLRVDRTGIAVLGAIAMSAFGAVTIDQAVRSVDVPTILLLYSLMIVSAQLRLGGFYTWIASRISARVHRPGLLLLACMLSSAVISALLTNDIVCFAFTPVLVVALTGYCLNPMPFLLGLAISSNIGSAMTIIGNPQNMLIGQLGNLDFGKFSLWSLPPAVVALAASFGIVYLIYRRRFNLPPASQTATASPNDPYEPVGFDRRQTIKGLITVVVLVALFLARLPRPVCGLGAAGILLASRKFRTREILAHVDWHLITLFCALFVVVAGIVRTPYPGAIVATLMRLGFDVHRAFPLTALSVVTSNIFSNVPATMLLVRFLDHTRPTEWYTLALSSTFAGNLFLIGSIANLIVAERAAALGVRISFREHAVVGVPVTVVSLAILLAWSLVVGA